MSGTTWPPCVRVLILIFGLISTSYAHDAEQHAPPTPTAALETNPSSVSALTQARLNARNLRTRNPALMGQWSEPAAWPVLAVHANLLPTGQVIAWDATPDDFDDDPHTTQNYTTRVTVWDPVAETHKEAYNDTNADLFCSGSAHLWDGRIVFAGGDSGRQGRNGPLSNSSIYDPWSNTWTQSDRMNAPRWYSSVAPLANGELLTFGGTYSPSPIAEVLQFNKQWRSLPIQTQYTFSGDYSWLQTTGDGDVMYLGPHNTLSTLNTEGSGLWSTGPERDDVAYRGYGSYALYDVDNVLIAGGGDSVPSSVVVDMSSQTTTRTGDMNIGRRQHNLTLLADGSVLATGGNSSGADLLDLNSSIMTPEVWDPDTGEWSPLADMQRVRQYHSVALLLPDGRVLSAGGGYCGICSELKYHEQNAEIFSPPYLFDENGQAAERPIITALPTVATYAQNFIVSTPTPDEIVKAHLIKLGSVTHSQNQEQRLVPLEFSKNRESLQIQAPANREIAPPGHYLLFIVNAAGTPSVGKILQIGQPLIKSDEVVVNTLRPQHWDYYEIQGTNAHTLTVSVQGELEEVDLYVNSGRLPTGPADNNGFFDCLSSGGQSGGKICVVSAQEDTTWYLGVLGQRATRYSLLANVDDLRTAAALPVQTGTAGAPSIPLNLRGQLIGFNKVELFWDAAFDDNQVAGYEIWRDGNRATFTTGLSYSDNLLAPVTQYAYQVIAVDNEQNRSPATDAFLVTTTIDPNADLDTFYHPEIPSTPGSFRLQQYSANNLELFWEHSIDNQGISGYEVYRNDLLVAFTEGVSYYDSSISPGTTYTYYIVAVDSDQHRSPPTKTVSINTPDTPELVDTSIDTPDVVNVDGENSDILSGEGQNDSENSGSFVDDDPTPNESSTQPTTTGGSISFASLLLMLVIAVRKTLDRKFLYLA